MDSWKFPMYDLCHSFNKAWSFELIKFNIKHVKSNISWHFFANLKRIFG